MALDKRWQKVHHRDKKGKLVKTTGRRVVVRQGFPVLWVKTDTDVNKFTYPDNTPYKYEDLPEEIKSEYAYLFENKVGTEEAINENKPDNSGFSEAVHGEMQDFDSESDEREESDL